MSTALTTSEGIMNINRLILIDREATALIDLIEHDNRHVSNEVDADLNRVLSMLHDLMGYTTVNAE